MRASQDGTSERRSTLLLTRTDVLALLDLDACIAAVEGAFRSLGEGRASPPAVLSVHGRAGGFHIKAGVLESGRRFFAAKINGNFPENRARSGLPTIQGVVVLCDADDGTPLAFMDSAAITSLRTGAATAVAAKHLARADASSAAIIGCGVQGRVQLRALARVRRLARARVHDRDRAAAEVMAAELAPELGIPVQVSATVAAAVRGADLCVTCTPSTEFLLDAGMLSPGAFVAGVGTDSETKRELAPDLLARSRVTVDLLAQCAAFGDLHHALAAGVMRREDVHAELAEIVAGRKAGRLGPQEITLFDSTGMALQDAAAAAVVYQRAVATTAGIALDFAS